MMPEVVTPDSFELLPFNSYLPSSPPEVNTTTDPGQGLTNLGETACWVDSAADTGSDTESQLAFTHPASPKRQEGNTVQVATIPKTTTVKQGRPVADRSMGDEDLLKVFRSKLKTTFGRIENKFVEDSSRTDKYRTMFVRQCRRVLAEVMGMIGVDSYSKSTDVERFLPEYEKRFQVMKRLVDIVDQSSSTRGTVPCLDS